MLSNYKCSFILRLWRGEQSNSNNWQASIEIPETGKRIGFASLEQLFAFLMEFTERSCDPHLFEHKEVKDGQVR